MNKVIFDDVYQEELLLDSFQELVTLTINSIYHAPVLCPVTECFRLPYLKCLVIHDCWLQDFSACKYSPRDCVDLVFSDISHVISFLVHCLIGHSWLGIKERLQLLKHFRMNEELDVCLLINVTILFAPPKYFVCRWHSINLWLRVDCQEQVLIHENQER